MRRVDGGLAPDAVRALVEGLDRLGRDRVHGPALHIDRGEDPAEGRGDVDRLGRRVQRDPAGLVRDREAAEDRAALAVELEHLVLEGHRSVHAAAVLGGHDAVGLRADVDGRLEAELVALLGEDRDLSLTAEGHEDLIAGAGQARGQLADAGLFNASPGQRYAPDGALIGVGDVEGLVARGAHHDLTARREAGLRELAVRTRTDGGCEQGGMSDWRAA